MIELKSVNLIPKEILERDSFFKRFGKGRRIYAVVLVLSVVIVSSAQEITVGLLKRDLTKSKKGIQEAKIKLNQLQSQSVQLQKTKDRLIQESLQREGRLELLGYNALSMRSYSTFLSLIAELVPQDMWINDMIFHEEEFEINGSALDNQLITQFMNQLDESKVFKNSRFTSFEKKVTDDHTLYRFQVTTEPLWPPQI